VCVRISAQELAEEDAQLQLGEARAEAVVLADVEAQVRRGEELRFSRFFPIPKRQALTSRRVDPATRGRSKKFFDELEWYACALRDARNKPCERSECTAQQVGPTAG
jgi:hypothetical protein